MWVLLGLGFALFEAYAIPCGLAYNIQTEGVFFYLVSVINAYFLLCILMSFMTGYVDDGTGTVVMSPR